MYKDYFKGFENTLGVAEMFENNYTCYFKLKKDDKSSFVLVKSKGCITPKNIMVV